MAILSDTIGYHNYFNYVPLSLFEDSERDIALLLTICTRHIASYIPVSNKTKVAFFNFLKEPEALSQYESAKSICFYTKAKLV